MPILSTLNKTLVLVAPAAFFTFGTVHSHPSQMCELSSAFKDHVAPEESMVANLVSTIYGFCVAQFSVAAPAASTVLYFRQCMLAIVMLGNIGTWCNCSIGLKRKKNLELSNGGPVL